MNKINKSKIRRCRRLEYKKPQVLLILIDGEDPNSFKPNKWGYTDALIAQEIAALLAERALSGMNSVPQCIEVALRAIQIIDIVLERVNTTKAF